MTGKPQKSERAADPAPPAGGGAGAAAGGTGGGAGAAGGKLRIAVTGDLHAHKAPLAVAPAVAGMAAAVAPGYRAMFAEISEHADVLCLCGDLTNHGLPEEAEVLAEDLAALRIPCAAVLGNHDHQSGQADVVKRILGRAGVTFLGDERLEIGGVGFAGTKGFGGGFGAHMLGSFGEAAIKSFVSEGVNEALALENAMRELTTERRVVVLHYAPVAASVVGEPPEIFPFLGCSRLGETIDRFDNVAAVFHGHAHHGAYEAKTPGGAPVYNCSVEVLRKRFGRLYVVIEVPRGKEEAVVRRRRGPAGAREGAGGATAR